MKSNAILVFVFFCFALSAQENKANWSIAWDAGKKFIENKGQFDDRSESPNENIQYGVDYGEMQIFFTPNGITYRFERKVRNPDRPKGNRTMPKRLKEIEFVHLIWENVNPGVVLEGLDQNPDYHVYSFVEGGSYYQVEDIRNYQKLVYKNLYPNIDAEYVFHPEGGLKYSLIVHPGGDVSQVKMRYPENTNINFTSGKIIISTGFGDIIEHEPLTFYAENEASVISSSFKQSANTFSFHLDNYDKTKSIIVDPWVQTPTLSNTNAVWEVEVDAAGNVYIIGGDSPMRLQKYNTAGVLQWTHNTPYSVQADSVWLGTLATDNAGNSYVTNGSVAAIQRINTNGSVVWNNSAGLLGSDEYWNIAFNCDQTKLIVGGTANVGNPLFPDLRAAIFNINTNNGNVNGFQVVATGTLLSLPPNPALQEVRSITGSYNAKYYFMTHDTIGSISDNISLCGTTSGPLFKIDHGYKFGYKCENYRPNHGNGGMMSIRANKNYVYTQNGTTIHRRSLADASILGTASIPGGISTTTFGLRQAGNSGIAIDSCGNVYVGSSDRVVKYDANLNLITSVNTSFKVFDVAIAHNGEILVAGATGTGASSSRTGYVQSINMNACIPNVMVCCDATICPEGPFCADDAPVTLTRSSPGGTWSGPGITNTSTGLFNPSIAGPGTHNITYSLSCGSDTIRVIVNDCATLQVCVEPNGDYTVTGGTGPYAWQTGTPFQNCTGCPFSFCNPFCPGFPDTTWTTFSTNATATPPGTFPIRVRDSGINALTLMSAASLPNCTTCPTVNTNISKTDASCAGSDGSASANPTGGTQPYNYLWSTGSTAQTITGLSAGNYTVTITDGNSCTATGQVSIGSTGGATVLLTSKTNVSCGGAGDGAINISVTGGTPSYTYSWSNGATTQNLSGLSGGTYTVSVTDANNCVGTLTESITEPVTLTVAGTVTNAGCETATGAIALTVTGGTSPYTFLWSNNSTTQNLSNLSAGNYSVTVTDNNSCSQTSTFAVNAPGGFTLSLSATQTTCSGIADGAVSSTVSGGNGPFQYNWSNGATTQNISNLPGGVYTVIVSDASNCTVAESALVSEPNVISSISSITQVNCSGDDNGGIKLNPFGGTPPYQAQWSNSDTGLSLTSLAPGLYEVTLTDANGCQYDTTISLEAVSEYLVEIEVVNASCDGTATGSVQANIITATTPPYRYEWNTGDSTASINNISPGTYTVTVRDNLNCIQTETAVVNSGNLVIDETIVHVSCPESSDGSIIVNVEGGNLPYIYNWSTGVTTDRILNIPIGTYTITVTDFDNCTRADTFLVMIDSNSTITCDTLIIYDVFSPNGDGINDLWVIDGIHLFGNHELQIFNRWGSLVFEARSYDNTWDGRSKKGEHLPVGTYYYILKLNDAANTVKSGHVNLMR